MNKPLLIAHRGDAKHFPENTIEAFESAFQKGADGIELDVHLDSNSKPIVVHDYLHDRSKNYPLLSQVLEKFSQKGRIEIEIKALEEKSIEIISETINIFRPFDLEVTTSVQPLMPLMTKYFPRDKRGFIFRNWLIEDWMTKEFKTSWIINHLKLAHATTLHLDLDLYNKSLVEKLHQQNITTHTHLTESTKEIYENVCNLGIDQCTFNDIDIIKLRKKT